MEGEWEREKEKILNSLLGVGQELEFPTEAEVLQATPLSMHGRSALDAVAMAYAREVYVRNEAALQGLSHSFVTTFHDASTKFVDQVRWTNYLTLDTHRIVAHLSSSIAQNYMMSESG